MEKNFLAKQIVVKNFCDYCGTEMELEDITNGAYMTRNFIYKCPKCGNRVISDKEYPYYILQETNTPVITKK